MTIHNPIDHSVNGNLKQAVDYHQAGQLQEAERLYRAILQAQPNHPDANHNLGVLAMQVKRPAAGLPHLKAALEGNQQHVQYWLSYIEALIQANQNDAARQVLEQGRQRGLQGEAVEAFALRLGSAPQGTEQTASAARPDFLEALPGDTKSPKPVHPPQTKPAGKEAAKGPGTQAINALVTLFNQGRLVEAEPLARSMTEQYPQHGFGWKVLGAVLGRMGRGVEALPAMQNVVKLSPNDADAHSNLGLTLHMLNRLSESEASFRRALQLKPEFAEGHYNLGNTLRECGRLAEAEASYRRALQIKPGFADVLGNLGITLRELDRRDEAVASFRQALQLKPDFADAHYNLGITLHLLGQLIEAEQSFQRALQLKPDFAEAHNNLGNIFREFGRFGESEACYRRALQLKPDFAEAYSNHGAALRELGRLPESEASYRRAIQIKPDFAEAHYNLGVTLLEMELLDEAETSCHRALQLKPDCVEVDDILNNIFRKRGLLPDYLEREVFDFANGRLLQRYFPCESNTFIYCIDVSGTCNLRCPSCPVGNSPDAIRSTGFMEMSLFLAIVEKIKRESVVKKPEVWLFNWGEPLLHPKLPEMIAVLKKYDFCVTISTNLNIKRNLEKVMRSGPDKMKISLSGFSQEFYSKTHTKGSIELVKENMRLIRDVMNNYKVPTRVRVGHHVYRHNMHESAAIEKMCKTLGFDYKPIQAFYSPLEKMVNLIEGKSSASETDFLANLMQHPLDALLRKQKTLNKDLDCEMRFNMTVINHDGSVALCCGWYDHENMLGVDFLDAPHDKIQEIKYRHPLCKKCYDYGLQYSKPLPDHNLSQDDEQTGCALT